MKFWKGFSFFFIYPFTMMLLGFLGGVMFVTYFYPTRYQSGTVPGEYQELDELQTDWQRVQGSADAGDDLMAQNGEEADGGAVESAYQYDVWNPESAQKPEDVSGEAGPEAEENSQEVAFLGEKLSADTAYVLEETDLRSKSVVETTWKLPARYIGMDREQFLSAMDSYEASPPLSELERGFVSLEVLSFSRDKVVVRMNYEYVQPTASFYLVVENDYVVVYLDDRQTVYMYTDILLTDLPDSIQQDIIHWMYIPDEESLYDFLENYSS